MKKRILFTFIVLFALIGIVSAKQCTVVSGTGKEIGDEITCGKEHFYIIENDETNTKLLSKYNLYVGRNAYLDNLDKTYSNYSEAQDYLESHYDLSEGQDYSLLAEWNEDHTASVFNKVYYRKSIDSKSEGYGIQNKLAIGAHGNQKGVSEYPVIGNIYIDEFFQLFDNGEDIWNNTDEDIMYKDFSIKGYEELEKYLINYKKYLENEEYTIKNIDLITVDEINNIVKRINGEGLPLGEWKPKDWDLYSHQLNYATPRYAATVGSIKDYVDSKYDWIWSTTYWTRTYSHPADNRGDPDLYDGPNTSNHEPWIYFVDTQGDLCATSLCFASKIGAGIRPVITINTSDILESSKEFTPEQPKEEPKEEKNPETTAIPSYILVLLLITISLIFINQKYKSIHRIK